MESRTLAPVLSYILSKMVERNDKIPLNDLKRTVFHAHKTPIISIHRYLERVLSFAPCSNSCFIVALIYIDRIIQTKLDFVLNSLSVHRMLITSVMVSTKFFDDETYNNLYYAKVGGLQVNELNQLENQFLKLIEFDLTIKNEVYERYHSELMKHVTLNGNTSKAPVAPLRSKLSQEFPPAKINTNTRPLSHSTNSLTSTHSIPLSVPSEKDPTCIQSPRFRCEKKEAIVAKQSASHYQSPSHSHYQSQSQSSSQSQSQSHYQSGFDYTARDLIPTNEDTIPLNFGTLTVSGGLAMSGMSGGLALSGMSGVSGMNYQCTPYSSNHQPQMVALSRG